MSFIKHIGKHGDRKVCILFRQVPNEEWMSLVIYPEILPAHWHDSIMKVLESPIGQAAEELADALHRNMFPDGRLMLETLHHERMIKKVKSADILVTPRPGASIRLDELNKMLTEMKQGQEAIEKMAKNDASRGLVDPFVKRAAEEEFKKSRTPSVEPLQASEGGALTDRDIASNMLSQAKEMEAQAKALVAEASRMKKEAEKLNPRVSASPKKTKTPVPQVEETVVKETVKPKATKTTKSTTKKPRTVKTGA